MNKVHNERVEIGQCPYKGRWGIKESEQYCDGKESPGSACLAKYLFFGLAAATRGGRQFVAESKGPCPDYSELRIPYDGKDEHLGLVDGGRLDGFKPGGRGPCIFFEVISRDEKLLEHLKNMAALTREPDAEQKITNYLKEHFGAPEDIREKARDLDENSNAPRDATPQIKGYEDHLVQKACSI